jgi:Asp-tRNA(Asn)/Glu-tRNA(Gln) amidotransferase C subunit
MNRITPETVRQLAQAAGIRPDEARLGELTQSLAAIIEAVERCEELGLEAFEPAINLRLDDRTGDVRG